MEKHKLTSLDLYRLMYMSHISEMAAILLEDLEESGVDTGYGTPDFHRTRESLIANLKLFKKKSLEIGHKMISDSTIAEVEDEV